MATKQMSNSAAALGTEAASTIERRRLLSQKATAEQRKAKDLEAAEKDFADKQAALEQSEYGRLWAARDAARKKLLDLQEDDSEQRAIRDKLWILKPECLAKAEGFRDRLKTEMQRLSVDSGAAFDNRDKDKSPEFDRKRTRIQSTQRKMADELVRLQPDPAAYIEQIRREYFQAESEDAGS